MSASVPRAPVSTVSCPSPAVSFGLPAGRTADSATADGADRGARRLPTARSRLPFAELQGTRLQRQEHGCPVSLIMRYGQRAELRCLKYLRRLRASVVSRIMRQIDAMSVLSRQVKEPVPHRGETPTRMPHIRVSCLGLDETGQREQRPRDSRQMSMYTEPRSPRPKMRSVDQAAESRLVLFVCVQHRNVSPNSDSTASMRMGRRDQSSGS